jgi:hypothetical protein
MPLLAPSLRWLGLLLVLLPLLSFGQGTAIATDEAPANPMAAFERLVGGEWHFGDQYQVFEWGLGKRSIHARGYQVVKGEAKLVSDGLIFYHPGEERLRGYFVAEGMGIDVFDYDITFEGDRMVAALKTFGQLTGEFEEVWEFTDADHYEWSLLQETLEGKVTMMSGTFARQ